MSIAKPYAQNLWQLGNILTGFAVTEALIVILAIGSNPHFENRLILNRYPAMGLTLIAHIAFCSVVWWCHAVEMRLLPQEPRRDDVCAAIRILRWEKLLAIGLFGLMLFLIILQAGKQKEFGP